MEPFDTIKNRGMPVFLLAVSFALLSPWIAVQARSAESPLEQSPGIVQGETKQGFAYMSGGVGIDERELMGKLGKAYNLKLSFAEISGPYLADVGLIIEDTKGAEIISTTTNGPWFYIQLPSGTYTIKATVGGNTKQIKNLQLSKGERISRTVHWDLD